MAIVTFLGLISMIGLSSFGNRAIRLEATEAARMMKIAVQRARMDAIYSGLNHYVVVDRDQRRVQVFADRGTTDGEFDAADVSIFSQTWGSGAAVTLPAGATSVSHPLGGSAITTAWSMPTPDSSAQWGTDLIGFTLTSRGIVRSASSTPATINSGTVIFSTKRSRVSAVVLRGRMGNVDSYELLEGTWKKL